MAAVFLRADPLRVAALAVSTRAPGDDTQSRFFEIWDDGHAQPNTLRFTYRRAAFFNTLKSKTGLMVARAAALRRILPSRFDGGVL